MALLPLAAQLGAERQTDRALQTFRSLTAITAVAIAVAVAVGVPLLPVIFGSSFSAAQSPFLWLLPGAFGYVALGVFSSTLVASAPGLSSVGPLVSLVVGLVLDVLLIPRFGADGAGIAASVAFLLGGAAALLLFRRRSFFAWKSLVCPQQGDLYLLRALVALPFSLRRHAASVARSNTFPM